ncbi:MAG TPA: RusA family crossover junction endodeoxyribonuclease [Planctomycetota bacterium]|nr:RusA family crossover junction endodeoxyribonuclease [Planctomycetota bacterium]
MIITLPWPPSMNHYWRRVGNQTIISAAGRIYRDRVVALAQFAMLQARCRTLTGRAAVVIEAFPPDLRRRDLDNLLKPLLDALQHARCYWDDSQIDDLHVRRKPPERPAGKIIVTIEDLDLEN